MVINTIKTNNKEDTKMKRVVFISIILIMPFIDKAQWQTMVDKIFSCHSVRYEHGSYEMRDY